MNILLLAFASIQSYLLWQLWRTSNSHEARLTRLESRQPNMEPKAPPAQAKQVFEKPVVKNAKEVKPLEIGDGRMRFDAEAQIAEWI